MARLVFGIVALLATAAAQGVPEGKDYLILQLQNPLVDLPARNGERNPGSRDFSFGPAQVFADDIKVKFQVSGLQIEGGRLRLGGILSFLKVPVLRGIGYYKTPEVYWHWGPRIRWVQRHAEMFRFHNLGVNLISKRATHVVLPQRLLLRVTYKNGQLLKEMLNREEVTQSVLTQVDRLFDDSVFSQNFNVYSTGINNAFIDPVADRALKELYSVVAAQARQGVKEDLSQNGFLDLLVEEAFSRMPPLHFVEGETAELSIVRDVVGGTHVLNVLGTKWGTSPAPELLAQWMPTAGKDANRFRMAVAPNALQHLVDVTLRQDTGIEGWPEGLAVDNGKRELIYTPKAAEQRTLKVSFALVLGFTVKLPADPVLVMTLPWDQWDNVKFKRVGARVATAVKLRAYLADRGQNGQRTPPIDLVARLTLEPDFALHHFELKLLNKQGNVELVDLAPTIVTLLQRSLGVAPSAAVHEVGQYARISTLSATDDPAEAIVVDFLQPVEPRQR